VDGIADRIKLYCGDIMSLEPEPVDSVLSYAVLHHLPEHLDEVVAMIRRWLTPGSVFICLEPVCSPSQPPQVAETDSNQFDSP